MAAGRMSSVRSCRPTKPWSRNLKTLEAKGFVSRRQQGTDRRYKYLYLTPKARELQDTMEEILRKWVDVLVQGVDEVTLGPALQLMHQVADNAAEADIAALNPTKGERSHERD